MIQHGQVFKLKTRGADGQPLWAYRYRLEGRSSERPQVGGFASRAEAEQLVASVSNGSQVAARDSRPASLPAVAVGCVRSAPQMLHAEG